ncbi:extracellular solute-binding protein [Streptococcus iners]|uniref:Extracellular solute-binding protein n=1 Tax=Streptococcus iners TaxID=3028084 RepID=A0AA96VMT3_9STRE|nr:extracellular solute-binding protein [Streptococcus sp. 29887]MCK4025696.1 extracellular solute-binding protein [Streptococcus suis]WNY52108.1 extracellular solute-binding protein [Streptococcus sp. 29887]
MKNFKKLCMFASVTTLLTACGTTTSNESTTGSSTEEIDYSQEIVIYSNSTTDGRGEWLKEQASEKGFNISYVDISGGELADRLIAEKNNSIADMVFGLNNLEFNRIKDEGLLVKYSPEWIGEVDSSLGDSDGYYHPLVVQPLVLIGNSKVDMPSDWTDLTKDSYKGTYGISALSTGTSKNIFASIVSRYADENGDLGISDEGWEVAKKYIQNAHTYAQGEDYISALIDDSNPLNYSMMWGSGVLQNEAERGYKFQIMSPKVGVPYVTEQIGILSTSKKEALVKEFINWFGSADVQKAWSDEFGSIPANKTALEGAKAEIKEFASSVKPQELDWEFIGENINSWVEKAELEFVE